MAQIRKTFTFGSGENGLVRQQKYLRVAKILFNDEEQWQHWLRTLADREAEKVLKNELKK